MFWRVLIISETEINGRIWNEWFRWFHIDMDYYGNWQRWTQVWSTCWIKLVINVVGRKRINFSTIAMFSGCQTRIKRPKTTWPFDRISNLDNLSLLMDKLVLEKQILINQEKWEILLSFRIMFDIKWEKKRFEMEPLH